VREKLVVHLVPTKFLDAKISRRRRFGGENADLKSQHQGPGLSENLNIGLAIMASKM
jgi:hypothetical protein